MFSLQAPSLFRPVCRVSMPWYASLSHSHHSPPCGLAGKVGTEYSVGAGWGWRLAIETVTDPESELLGHLLKMHIPEPSIRNVMGDLYSSNVPQAIPGPAVLRPINLIMFFYSSNK